jgi:DHA1 family multidrug/chloramphenicol efflux transport protein-like MFS transporter
MTKTHIHPKSLTFPILLVLYEIATYLSNDMYLPALPQMMKEIGLSTKQAQATLTTWFIGSAFLPLVMGVISDRYGRRPVLLLGGVIYILATIACAITSDTNTLLIARFIEGAAIPSMMVAGYACIHELYDQKEAIRILALMGSITVLAPALGPLLGSIVLYFTSWRGIFWFISIWALIIIVLLVRWMPETFPPEKRQPIHYGTLFIQYARVLTNKKFMLLMMVLGFIFTGFIVWITAGPLLVIENFHYPPIVFGMFQAFVFAAYIAGNHLVKHILEFIKVSTLIRLGLFITLAGGILAFVSSVCFAKTIYPFLMSMTIYSFGSALCFSPLNRSIIEASDEPMSVRVSLFTVLWTGFAVLGSAIASLFFSGSILSISIPVAVVVIISAIMKIAAAYLP